MKKFKIIYLFILALLLVGCGNSVNIEIFRFVNHENNIQVGEEISLELIMGEYAEDAEVKYTISNPEIISFENGIAKGLAEGETEVKATVDNFKFATTKVIVTREPIDALQILSSKNIIYIDETLQLDTKIYPSHFSKAVKWSIESGSDVASISEAGLITPKRAEKDAAEFNAGGAKVRVVATSIEDETVMAKKDFYVKFRPTTVVTVTAPDNKTEFLISELTGDTSIELTVGKAPQKSYPYATFTSTNAAVVTAEFVDGKYLAKFPATLKAGIAILTVRTLDGRAGSITFTINEVVE